jgi:hypothetical protein
MVPPVMPLFLVRHSCTRSSPGKLAATSLGVRAARGGRSQRAQSACGWPTARSAAVGARAPAGGAWRAAGRVRVRAGCTCGAPGDAQQQLLSVRDAVPVRRVCPRTLLRLVLRPGAARVSVRARGSWERRELVRPFPANTPPLTRRSAPHLLNLVAVAQLHCAGEAHARRLSTQRRRTARPAAQPRNGPLTRPARQPAAPRTLHAGRQRLLPQLAVLLGHGGSHHLHGELAHGSHVDLSAAPRTGQDTKGSVGKGNTGAPKGSWSGRLGPVEHLNKHCSHSEAVERRRQSH